MNNWLNELLAEEHRQELLEDGSGARLAAQVPADLPLLDRSMAALGRWMIAAGSDLRCRFDTSADCRSELSRGLAR